MSGSLRIRTEVPLPAQAPVGNPQAAALPPGGPGAPATPTAPSKSADDYYGRLVKLIPAEVIALYLGVKGTFKDSATNPLPLLVWMLVCLALVVLVRAVATYDKASPKRWDIQWGGVGIAAVSFVLWAFASSDNLVTASITGEAVSKWLRDYSSPAIAVWTFVVPYLYSGEPIPSTHN